MTLHHQAADSMNGYLYQVRYALFVLLSNDETNFKVSIEKFDDIAFEKEGTPEELIQTKHHGKPADLGDKSVDLWKTIKVWLDQIENNPDLLVSCRFLIVTTGTAPDNSAASLLRRDNRDEVLAVKQLREVATKHENTSLKAIYDKFLSVDENRLKKLFYAVEVVDGAPQIVDLEKEIKRLIRFCCPKGFENQVMEQLEGWWFELVVKALSSPDHTILDYNSAWNKINFIGHQYSLDNLPIEEWNCEDISDEKLRQDQRLFILQLRLINGSDNTLRRAIKNYYRAYEQRSSWVRNELLLPNELESYEHKLVDEWEETRAHMEEDADPEKQGRELHKKIMEKFIPIRKECTEPFVMRGSYEMLADKLEVGWHKDYLSKLQSNKITKK